MIPVGWGTYRIDDLVDSLMRGHPDPRNDRCLEKGKIQDHFAAAKREETPGVTEDHKLRKLD